MIVIRFAVHELNQEEYQRKGKYDRIILILWRVLFAFVMFPFIIIFSMLLYIGEIKYAFFFVAGVLLVLIPIAISVKKNTALPAQNGYLELADDILFHDTMRIRYHKRYQYHEIAWLYVGDCPQEFVKMKTRSLCYSQEEWRLLYGNYIVALDSQECILFAIRFSEKVWNTLLERCQNTIKHVIPEDGEYVRQKREIEEKTLEANGYQDKIHKFEGYIN